MFLAPLQKGPGHYFAILCRQIFDQAAIRPWIVYFV